MNVLFLGDSLVEFFDWQGRFPGRRAANLGVAGESVEGLHSRIGRIIQKYPEADLVFIMTGINNVAMEDFDFFDVYGAMIEELKSAYPKAQIHINSLLPVLVDFISNDSIQKVNDSLQRLARDGGVKYIDVYRSFVDDRGTPVKEYYMYDGVHLSDRGYAVWSALLAPVISGFSV